MLLKKYTIGTLYGINSLNRCEMITLKMQKNSFYKIYERFLSHLELTKNPPAVRTAKSVIKRFIEFIDKNHPDIDDLKSIEEDNIITFLSQFSAPTYKSNVLYYLRLFFQFGEKDYNPALSIPYPRINYAQGRKFFSEEDINAIFQELEKRVSSEKNLREAAFILLLLCCGLRTTEGLSLLKEDLKNDGFAIIRDSKTNKSRIVYVPQIVVKAIHEYHLSNPSPSPYVFYPRTKNAPLSYTGLRSRVKEIFISAGIKEKNKALHALRHTYAMRLFSSGIDIFVIQKLLGHSTLKTTQIYTQVLDSHIRNHSDEIDTALSPFTNSIEQIYRLK